MAYDFDQSVQPTRPGWQVPLLILLTLAFVGFVLFRVFYKPQLPQYVSQEGRFKVSFFAEPHQETLPVNDGYFATNLYLTVEHTSTPFHCQVGYMDIPENAVNQYGVESIYDIVQRYVVLPGSQVTAVPAVCDGIQGREVTVVTASNGTAICRFFLKGNRVYRCLIADKDGSQITDPRVKQFLDSFHML